MRPNNDFETGKHILVEAKVVGKVLENGITSYCLELTTDNGEPSIVDYVKAETLHEIPEAMVY